MFPVTTRPYEVGSKDDSNATGGANLAIGVGAGVIAVGVIAAGLLVLGSSGECHQYGVVPAAACCIQHFTVSPYREGQSPRPSLLACSNTAQLQQQQQQ
jgi:hypothetical protein